MSLSKPKTEYNMASTAASFQKLPNMIKCFQATLKFLWTIHQTKSQLFLIEGRNEAMRNKLLTLYMGVVNQCPVVKGKLLLPEWI